MYKKILVGLDGSSQSNHAMQASLDIAKATGSQLIGCHVYAAEMHRARFAEMEIGLPQRYQEGDNIKRLRDTHEDIISGGMRVISDAYLSPLLERASKLGIKAEGSAPEGRNYSKFVELVAEKSPDLAIIGAEGHGKVPEVTLGSFAERSLLLLPNQDVLIMRTPWDLEDRPIVVGIDGSDASYEALCKAAEIAKLFGASIKAVAVYDPFFHKGVFTSISEALTQEQSNKFNFKAQQRLHDEIIDDGLLSLYAERVDRGIGTIKNDGIKIEKKVLTGKVFSELSKHASDSGAGLLVVGRHGIHREPISIIGSNAQALSRISLTNLLVVSAPPNSRPSKETTGQMSESGNDAEVARVVVLKKANRFAPSFHEDMVREKIKGATVEKGQRFNVYIVKETEPPGKVRVDVKTELRFE